MSSKPVIIDVNNENGCAILSSRNTAPFQELYG